MKQLFLVFGVSSLLACTKSDSTSTSNVVTPPVSTNPSPAPATPVVQPNHMRMPHCILLNN